MPYSGLCGAANSWGRSGFVPSSGIDAPKTGDGPSSTESMDRGELPYDEAESPGLCCAYLEEPVAVPRSCEDMCRERCSCRENASLQTVQT